MSEQLVRLEVADGIGTIRLDRPPMNVFNVAMQDQLAVVAAEAAGRADVAAVVVFGGEKVFAAGADVKEMAGVSHAQIAARSTALQAAFTAVARIPKPVVAAITGYALGGGCELALCADFRVAASDAKLGQPEILLGIIPGAGGTQRLPRLIGPARAKELIFSGRLVSADEALALGLVDQVVAPDQVESAARAMVARYVGGPALALALAKRAVDDGLAGDLAAGLEIERAGFVELFATADRTIGMDHFVQKGQGPAPFVGR